MLDKSLDKALRDLGLHPGETHFMLPKEEARDLGATCRDCGSHKVVYFITKPLHLLFDAGGYCYPCLLNRCRKSRMIPYPIEQGLLNSLQEDMSIPGHHVMVVKFEA